MHIKSKLALAAAFAISSVASIAQTAPEPENSLTYNIGVVSQYRYRAIEQTSGKPAIQAGLDYAHKSGFYLGAFATNVTWIKDMNLATTGDYEIDIYGGYKGELVKDVTYDLGVITYNYPGNNSGDSSTPGAGTYSKADTKEFYVGMTYGVVTAKYSQSIGDFLGNLNSNGSRYFEVAATFDLGNGLSVTPHIGRQTIPNQSFGTIVGNAADYSDYSLTLTKDFGEGLTAYVTALATSATEKQFYQTTASSANGQLNRFLAGNSALVGVKYSF
jgi:uncharacterized protein (TIGR02001 family)